MTNNATLRCAKLFLLRAFMLVFLLIGSTFLPSEKAWSQNAEPRQAESRLSYEGLAEVLENDALRG